MTAGAFFAGALASAITLWLGGLLAVVVFSIVRGRISLRGLLTERLTGHASAISRPQLLLIALAAAVTYVGAALDNLGKTNVLPEAPWWLLAAMGGSNAVFLGGRGIAAVISKFLPGGGLR